MKRLVLTLSFLAIFLTSSQGVFADTKLNNLTLKTDFNIWKVHLNRVDWNANHPKLKWGAFDVSLDDELTDAQLSEVKKILSNQDSYELDFEKITDYLNKVASPDLHRDRQDVHISLDENGEVVFDGFAISGQDIDFKKTFHLIRKAYEISEDEVRIAIKTTQPIVNVTEELREKGVTHLLATGETDFSGSPANRINNIHIGLDSFNGQLIPPNEESGAGDILGTIDETTGYKEELVIKGDKTIPEYGGGLCQVSTTVYRSLLFAGIPITQRRNHSYAVSYYDPQGLDATIYPPYVDMKFKNDTKGHLLIQTLTTEEGKAYSNIYGTPTQRDVELIGPYYYAHKSAPAPRVEYTDQLPEGQVKKLGGQHDGFKASWYRRIRYSEEDVPEKIEHIYSDYQARPLYTLIGGSPPDEVEPVLESKAASN